MTTAKPKAPLRALRCIDLFCGLGGWSEGFLAEGYSCLGFDIECHDYGSGCYPGQLVLQDILTLHGSQFRKAAVIVASPPCQEYSYMAMPWKRAKQIRRALLGEGGFPEGYTGSRTVEQLNALFNACFRIQREASEAAGHHIPMVVENVKGAQPWVGMAKANYGSFFLWGDIGVANGNIVCPHRLGHNSALLAVPGRTGGKANPDGTGHGQESWFAIADSKNRGTANSRKVPGFNFHQHERDGTGGSFQSAAVKAQADGLGGYGGDFGWDGSAMRRGKSPTRKAASAQIAKIPLALSTYIAKALLVTTSGELQMERTS